MRRMGESASGLERFGRLSILMPVYNEARTLRRIISAVLGVPMPLPIELVCVDDCSRDASWEILQELAAGDARIVAVRHEVNRGKGSAIRTAISRMTGDIAIVQDADLEYDPREIPRVIAPILEGKADAVFGSRFASSPQRRVLLFWHSVANKLLTLAANVLNDINITDMETCYKAVRADVLRQIPLRSERFGIEPELTTRLAQWGVRIYEVPISYHGRTAAEGKKIGWKDAVSAGWCLFKCRFIDRRFTTHDGFYVLQSVRAAKGFNRWMMSRFARFLGRRVFEAGCGIGNFTELLLDRERLVCADHDPYYVEMLDRRYGHLANVRTLRMDLADAASVAAIGPERPDTIVSLNVVEHIERDQEVLENFFAVLEPGGHAIVLVPAHPWLYGECDRTLGHFRRYRSKELVERFERAGFGVVETREFNRLGVLGWWVNKVLGRRELSPAQMRLYEWLLPIAKLIDWVGLGPGLSLIVVGQKPVGAGVPLGEGASRRSPSAAAVIAGP
jgi:glycosyltransferase involved in cell wall biosynthesis